MQLRGAVRPAIATAVIFVGAALLSREIDVASWGGLLVGGALSAVVIALAAFFTGLPRRMRATVWMRLRKAARLT
jgi:hypothetical protein